MRQILPSISPPTVSNYLTTDRQKNMGRYKTYREPRRRGFDDENYSPQDRNRNVRPRQSQPVDMPPSESTEAIVQWFNSDKGFGFVKCTGGAEAFLHIRQLEAAGHSSVPEGARLRVTIGQGQKGPQVSEVLEVIVSTANFTRCSAAGGQVPDRNHHRTNLRPKATDR